MYEISSRLTLLKHGTSYGYADRRTAKWRIMSILLIVIIIRFPLQNIKNQLCKQIGQLTAGPNHKLTACPRAS